MKIKVVARKGKMLVRRQLQCLLWLQISETWTSLNKAWELIARIRACLIEPKDREAKGESRTESHQTPVLSLLLPFFPLLHPALHPLVLSLGFIIYLQTMRSCALVKMAEDDYLSSSPEYLNSWIFIFFHFQSLKQRLTSSLWFPSPHSWENLLWQVLLKHLPWDRQNECTSPDKVPGTHLCGVRWDGMPGRASGSWRSQVKGASWKGPTEE